MKLTVTKSELAIIHKLVIDRNTTSIISVVTANSVKYLAS